MPMAKASVLVISAHRDHRSQPTIGYPVHARFILVPTVTGDLNRVKIGNQRLCDQPAGVVIDQCDATGTARYQWQPECMILAPATCMNGKLFVWKTEYRMIQPPPR